MSLVSTQEKDIVSGVLSLGVTLANKGKDYMEKNEDADVRDWSLSGTKSKIFFSLILNN